MDPGPPSSKRASTARTARPAPRSREDTGRVIGGWTRYFRRVYSIFIISMSLPSGPGPLIVNVMWSASV